MDNNETNQKPQLTTLTPQEVQKIEAILNKLKFVGLGITEIIIDEPGMDGASDIIKECVKELESLLKK